MLVMMAGLPGVGKTYLANQIAEALGAVVLSVDSDYVEPWACDRLTVDTGRAAEDNLRAVLDYLAEPV